MSEVGRFEERAAMVEESRLDVVEDKTEVGEEREEDWEFAI